jgi:hypothetical protein
MIGGANTNNVDSLVLRDEWKLLLSLVSRKTLQSSCMITKLLFAFTAFPFTAPNWINLPLLLQKYGFFLAEIILLICLEAKCSIETRGKIISL